MGQPFFTSDLHIDHRSILKYTVRGPALGLPQQGEDEEVEAGELSRRLAIHNNWILNRINNVVGLTDHLYIIGDLFFGDQWLAAYWISQIRTKHRIFIGGNHDDKLMAFYKSCGLFESVHDHRLELKVDGRKFVLDHFPLVTWNGDKGGAIHLHGHLHGNGYGDSLAAHGGKRILDIGWDNSINLLGEYGPFSLKDVLRLVGDKPSHDHHNLP